MFNLPHSTGIKKTIYKSTIYKKFPKELSGNRKKSFDEDIKKITIINEISEESVNLKASEDISAIFVLLIEMKNRNFDQTNINLLSRLFGQKLLFILKFEDEYKLAIYETRLLTSNWKELNEIELSLEGLELSTVWENLVKQVGNVNLEEGNSLVEQISKNDKKDELIKKIKELDKKARKEPQAKKKYEIFKTLQSYKKNLEEL